MGIRGIPHVPETLGDLTHPSVRLCECARCMRGAACVPLTEAVLYYVRGNQWIKTARRFSILHPTRGNSQRRTGSLFPHFAAFFLFTSLIRGETVQTGKRRVRRPQNPRLPTRGDRTRLRFPFKRRSPGENDGLNIGAAWVR